MQQISSSNPTFKDRLEDWFYAREVPYALAIVRILFPVAMLVAVLPRWYHVREIYSTDGAPAPFWMQYGNESLLPIFSPTVAVGLFTLLIFCLICISLGWKTRVCLFAACLLVPYFGLLDALGTLTKYTIFATHVFLLLGCSHCGSVWSLDALLARRSNPDDVPPRSEVWPQRLLMLLFGFIYLGASATKLQTTSFFTGEQMYYWMLGESNFNNPFGRWLALYPSLIVMSCYLTVLWEGMFLFVVWRDPWRWIMLGMGVLFHIMTYFVLGLFVFPLLFLAAYPCFLKESEARRLGTWAAGFWPARSLVPAAIAENSQGRLVLWRQWPAFVGLLLTTSLVGIAAEQKLDIYQKHGPQGPITLEPLAPEVVETLLRNDRHLLASDQIMGMDFGTVAVGGYIADSRNRFRPGDEVLMQLRLIQPHNDLWLEYTLRDESGQVIARDGHLAPREETRIPFQIPLAADAEPGTYQVSVRVNGKPVIQRSMTVSR